jgi:FKBP-type peptidyl-prolyl cis-trans isomerase (trigger factor)
VAQEGISATDDEVDAEIERLSERLGQPAAKLRRDLEQRDALEAVRSEITRGKALEFLVERATVVDERGASVDLTLPAGEPAASASDEAQSTGAADVDTESEEPEE